MASAMLKRYRVETNLASLISLLERLPDISARTRFCNNTFLSNICLMISMRAKHFCRCNIKPHHTKPTLSQRFSRLRLSGVVIPTARDEVYTSYCLILGRLYWVKRMREVVKRSYQWRIVTIILPSWPMARNVIMSATWSARDRKTDRPGKDS